MSKDAGLCAVPVTAPPCWPTTTSGRGHSVEGGRPLRSAGAQDVQAGAEVRVGVPGPGQAIGGEEQQADREPDTGGGVPALRTPDFLTGAQVRYEQVWRPGGWSCDGATTG